MLPLLAFFSFAPAIPYLTRRTAQQDGPGREADNLSEQPAERFSVRRRVVIQDSAFWGVVIWLMMIPGFTITGLFFHQIFIAGEKAVPLFGYGHQIMSGMHCLLWPGRLYLGFWLTGSARIVWLAYASADAVCVSGVMVGTRPFLAASLFCVVRHGRRYDPPLVNALLAERYGTGWLGEIKALAMPMNVFASALSPALMGIFIDIGVSLNFILLLLLACSACSAFLPRLSGSICWGL